ncbi:AI-2E family transporter [Salinisphaera sp. USBA-960]|nr:AI-2E family transporter [Salifodinibacter halophilus]NNC26146.1 AI-2E family transporter [Salifodinibacter halophilus]
MTQQTDDKPTVDRQFLGRFLLACAVAAALVVAGWFVWYAINGLLLVIAAVILAIALDGLARLIHGIVPISRHLSIAAASVIVVACLAGIITFGAINVTAKAPQLRAQIAHSVDRISHNLEQAHLAPSWVRDSGSADMASNNNRGASGQSNKSDTSIGTRLSGQLSSAATLTISTLANAFVVAIIGFYLAFTPSAYLNALIRLVPKDRRQRTQKLLVAVGWVLRRWLIGRGLSMIAVGIGSAVGLALLDVPFAVSLGLIAGVLTFIPYLGAILSAVPAVLVAGLQGVDIAFYAAGLYLVLHILEGYILAPLIQRRAVSIAPGFLLIAQTLGFAIAGTFGMMLAAPISLCAQIFVQALYIEDVLGDQPHMPGMSTEFEACHQEHSAAHTEF